MELPLVRVALAYVSGAVLALWFPAGAEFGWLLLLAVALGWCCIRLEKFRPYLLVPFLAVCGAANLLLQTSVISPDDLRVLNDGRDELVTLRGVISETPHQSIYIRKGEETVRSIALVDATALIRGTNIEPATGTVVVSTPGVVSAEFFRDRPVEISGVLKVPRGPAAEGLFDYRKHLAWQGIHRQLIAPGTNDWRALDTVAKPTLSDRFQRWAMATLARGLPVEDAELRLLWAMALGWKTALTDDVSEPFMRSGTMHIFAISGLHIALIAQILMSLLRVLQLPRGVCGLIVIPLIWFYTAATGWQPSAIRSTIMMTVIILGWALERPSNLLNSLAASGFIIVLWQPQQLFQASFQLSFFVVLSIGLLMPHFEKLRQRIFNRDPLLPADALPRWRRWIEPPVMAVATSLATSLAAWIGSLPLIAWYFHMVTPVSLLANLLVVPLSSLALMCNLGSLVCAPLPWLTELFNNSAWFWMRLMIRASDWTTTLPTAFFYVRPPTAVQFLFYYTALLAFTVGWLTKTRTRVATLLALAAMALGCGMEWFAKRNDFVVTVLAETPAIYSDAPQRDERLLLDCGTASSVDLVVKPFLRACGVNSLPALLLTNGDTRHAAGATDLASLFPITRIHASTAPSRSPGFREALARLRENSLTPATVSRGDTLAAWEILHPATDDRFAQADDSSVVLTREIHGTRILLLSELGRAGQRALREREPALHADIVVAGLPALGEPLNFGLLELLQPKLVIIHDANYPAKLRAGKHLRERLAPTGVPIIFCSDSGSVKITLRPGGWGARSISGLHFKNAPASNRLATQ
jgi:ComEC/Rec2-related protein